MVLDSLRRRFDTVEAGELAALFLVLAGVDLWAALVHAGYVTATRSRVFSVGPPETIIVVGQFALYLVGTALAVVVYACLRGFSLPLGPPVGTARTVVATVLAPAALVALTGVLGAVSVGPGVGPILGKAYAPTATVRFLVGTNVVPAVFAGVARAFVVCVAVHETVRVRVAVGDSTHAVVLSSAVAAFGWVVTVDAGAMRSLLLGVRNPTLAVGAVASVFVGVCFGASVGLLYRCLARGSAEDVLRLCHGPVLGIGLLGVAAGLAALFDPVDVFDLLSVVAFAVAVYGYERTRSLWVPVASLATFTASFDVVAYAEAVFGLLPPV